MQLVIDITGRRLLLLALLLGALLRIPGWYTQEEMQIWRMFEPDEEQHLAITMKRYNLVNAGHDTIRHDYGPLTSYNVRGFGYLNAHLLAGWNRLTGQNPNFGATLRFGRQMSTLYGLLLVVVVYFLGRELGLRPPWAGVAANLVALADLLVTYQHYSLPLAGYLLFSYLALLGGLHLLRQPPRWSALALLAIGAAGAAAFKFDVFPTVWGGALLLWLCLRGRGRSGPSLPRYYLPLGTGLLAAAFLLLTYGWTWEEMRFSFETLRRVNDDVIGRDDHLRDNLVAYPLAVLAGIGLPAFGLAVWGTFSVLRERVGRWPAFSSARNLRLLYPAGFLLTEFGLLWYLDTTFVRRAAIFLPAVALLAAYALQRLRPRPWLVAATVAWSLGLALVGQSHHWFDTRYAFRDWANEELPAPLRVGITGYLNPEGLKNWRYFESADLDYFVIHESVSRRFVKSLTTPFGVPECCAEIYHCYDAESCGYIQDILLDRREDFELVRAFRSWDVFPERLLYHALFGYYETFLGDVLVYRRLHPKAGDHPLS